MEVRLTVYQKSENDMGKSKPTNWALGRWLIESMTMWDREFIDEEVRGFFEFDATDTGAFQFG